jgi:hypothetical protein
MNTPRKVLRRMGFIRDQHGIMNRYLREKSHWHAHLENTRRFISSSFAGESPGSVAVLGSGWLLDVPLKELSERFGKVYLVDIFHPPQVRKSTEKLERVELVEADLTGGAIEQVWRMTRKRGVHSPDNLREKILLEPPLSSLKPDVTVSVNLLNQLDIMLCDFLKKHRYFRDEPADRFRSLIQSFHVEWISAAPGCLITDTTEISIDRDGHESARSLLFTDLPEGFRKEGWRWDFDTQGTYRAGSRTRMEVQAVEWS